MTSGIPLLATQGRSTMTQLDGHPINFIRGWPHPSLFPTTLLSAATAAVLSDPSVYTPAIQYGDDPGYEPLRNALATWLHAHYAVERDPQRLCISGGASQNITSILSSFTDPVATRAVWCVSPTYHLVFGIFQDAGFGNRIRAFLEDEEGPDVEELERRLVEFDKEDRTNSKTPIKDPGPHRKFYRHIIYVVSTCANPSGKTMPLQRRQDLVRLARRHDALIISDDVYDLLQWPLGSPASTRVASDELAEMKLPRLCDIDLALDPAPNHPARFGNAVSNGSFSKMVGPGMRTGWLEGSRAFAFGLAQTGATKSGGSPSQWCAAILAHMVQSGAVQEHLASVVRPALQLRHRIITDAIQTHLQPLGVNHCGSGLIDGKVYGGYFIWIKLPNGLSADAVTRVALAERLYVGSGTMFQVPDDRQSTGIDNFLRLTFAYIPEEDLIEGIERLARVIRRVQREPEKYMMVSNVDLNSHIIETCK
ncbi:pyridoxal phosphate-dependent transferase [Xylariaceae sp. FL1272]|nr:pyridoxal phosphate-dependent transferase [Xylariaceae sp. FL1272]